MEQNDPEGKRREPATEKDYLGLSEQEKDEEITRAIIRLQNSIRNILFHEDQQMSGQEPHQERNGSREGNNDAHAGQPARNHEN